MKKEQWQQYFKKPTTILFLLSIVFFFIYSFLSYPFFRNNDFALLNQPDESINYIFTRHFVETEDFIIPEGLAYISNNQVHPRSTTVIHRSLTPIGFPGIIVIFGFITKCILFFTGGKALNIVLLSLTPIVAVASVGLFYSFIKSIFGKRIGFLSALLLFVLPPCWYYASRSLQHCTLFVFLFLLTLFFGMKFLQTEGVKWKQDIFAFLTGIAFGLTVYVRPAELIWLVFLGAVFLFLLRKQYTLKDFVFFLLGGMVMGILFFFTQQVFYDSFIGTGYAVPQSDGSSGIITGSIAKSFIFPFGIDILHSLRVLYVYGLKLILWWSLFGFLGFLFLFLKRKQQRKEWKYAVLFICVSVYLVFVYGSWNFTDNLSGDPSYAVSYTRYFLPIYVFALPFVALALEKLLLFPKYGKVLLSLSLVFLCLFSFDRVFFSYEGLIMVKGTVRSYVEEQTQVIQRTEENAVIVTRYADKYLYPKRKIIAGFEEEYYREAIVRLVDLKIPVYLYDLRLSEEQEQSLQNFLKESTMKVEEPLYTANNLELRHIIKEE